WELPGGPLASARTPRRPAVANHLRERLGLDAAIGSHLATVEHLFTHRHLTLDVYGVEKPQTLPMHATKPLDFYTEQRWVPLGELGDDTALPLSTLTRKVLRAVERRE
ncbi:MAG: hypothetical protein ACI9MR_004953, partial [Myxococcota bacterium]